MLKTAAHRIGSPPKKTKAKRLWVSVVMVLAMALAGIAVVATEAQAGSFSDRAPHPALMKGQKVLQHGKFNYSGWNWYEAGKWNLVYADGLGNYPRDGVLVRAGSRLHLKINKPEKPAIFKVIAYRNDREHPGWPLGEGRSLDTTLRPMKRDDKTVGWNAYFYVNRSDHHYLLETQGIWEEVPGTHISYGEDSMHYHVKTR